MNITNALVNLRDDLKTWVTNNLNKKADKSHTHNYAGSSSAGGSANSAVKLATARNINGVSFDGSADRTNYGTCSTAASTAAKTVDCTGFSLIVGAEITVKFTVSNAAANPTLNVNNTGAKPIFYRGAAIDKAYLVANRTYTFRYDGTNWDFVGDINVDTNTDTKVTQTNTTSDGDYRVLFSGTADDTSRAESARKSSKLKFNPSTGTLSATTFDGTASYAATANYAANASYAETAVTLSGLTATTAELNYMDGVTSNVQTQFDTVNDSLSKLSYVELTVDFDLNNAISAPVYRTSRTAVLQTLKNLPPNVSAGEITVEWKASDNNNMYGVQVAYHTNGSMYDIYTRYKTDTIWHDWVEITTLDELNTKLSNYLPLKGENLGSGDANTRTTSGTVTIGTPSNWSNLPENAHGILETFNAGYYILPRYTTGGNPRRIYHRYSGSNGDGWSDWDEFAMNADLNELDTQLGRICYKELYDQNGTSHIDIIKNNWVSLPSGVLMIKVISGTTQLAYVYKHDNSYGSVRFTGYFVDREYYYLLQNGTWTIKVENARMIDLANYLPLTGGTLSGVLSSDSIYPIATGDCYLGDNARTWAALYANNIMLAKNNTNYGHMMSVEGTTSEEGRGILYLGNSTPKGTAGNSKGQLRLYASDGDYASITPQKGGLNVNMPSASGTMARVEDLANYLPLSGGTITNGYIDLCNTSNGSVDLTLRNSERALRIVNTMYGVVGLHDDTNSEWILYSHPDRSVHIPHPTTITGNLGVTGLITSGANNGNLKMGAQNGTYCHMYADLPFYFNKDIYVNGDKLGKEVHSHKGLNGYIASLTNPSTTTGELIYGYNLNADKCGALPKTNNANGIMTINTHAGSYHHQLGFSSDNNLYHRAFNGIQINDSVAWNKIMTSANFSLSGTTLTITT